MRATDIIGYTFRADTYCPECINDALPTGEGEPYDGWGVASGVRSSPEDLLNETALAFGIDRNDERTFDSDDFPKVIFVSQVEDHETCGGCGRTLL